MSDLAVYDLDRTITRRPTYTLFLIHCAVRRQQWRLVFVPVVVIAMLAYALGLFDRGRLKEICQHLLIGHKVHATELRPLAESFADAIAQRLAFDDVIATGSVIGLDERVHARIAGENCYGEEKMRMIADWVEKSGLRGKHGHVRFYSDHASDEPAFNWSDEPVAVNPHDRLARMAEQRGWAVEDWG